MPQAPHRLNTFEALLQIIKDLRGLEGCPWDKEQTHKSLAAYAIEESHELAEALESGDDKHICEELGDVLFQVILHAELAAERKAFNIYDVIEAINSKIVRRHPHVFADTKVENTEEVIKNWDEIKKLEKKNKKASSALFDLPKTLPALQKSHKIGEKTQKYKFDWTEPKQVLAQLKSEITELEEAIEEKDITHIQHEIGDVLFSAAQLARHLGSQPEADLREANRRFISRFEKMVAHTSSIEEFTKLSSDEKEKLWMTVKKQSSNPQ
jgi:tetrapyrrole methylase family protein / MazG family protein